MNESEYLAQQFEANRGHLRSVAYRMLGSTGEADDAVQEAWLRLSRTDAEAVENLRGWLTTVVARISLDILRRRNARREEPFGERLPDPVVTVDAEDDPAQQAAMADSVGLALLAVLETLSPAERLAFVLHDMFGVSFDEIAPIVERSPGATRKLASRARAKARGSTPEDTSDIRHRRELVDAFLAAAREGDFGALLEILDPDVVFRVDQGEAAGLRVIHGASGVVEQASRYTHLAQFARRALVNGAPGAVVVRSGRAIVVAGFVVAGGRIVEIDMVADRARLSHLDVSSLDR
jgi:RNA polymerase sigma factor (sigma-70 family)